MSKTKRYFFDTEFVEGNKSLFDLTFISIGIVSDSGDQELYEISNEFNEAAIKHVWVLDNVVSKLDREMTWRNHEEICERVLTMLKGSNANTVEFWAKNGSYDNMILCRLFGGMMNFRKACSEVGIKEVIFEDINELRAIAAERQITVPAKDEKLAHIAIEDAKVERSVYHAVMGGPH